MPNHFHKTAKIALVLVYLVIIAGAGVRMTGSGMGCPDWPKCFGYYIPPTELSQLQWQPEKSFKKGQIIIRNDALFVAIEAFKSSDNFIEKQWQPYTKHDYAVFNPTHTWVEFVNRLFGALAGLATLVLAFLSISYWRTNKSITAIAWIVVIAMGFQAWLGATVVFSVLEPVKITIHMLMALIIVALLLYLIHGSITMTKDRKSDKIMVRLLMAAILITLVQVVLGTQVRQFVDVQIDTVGENAKNLWLEQPSVQFYVHRSFSILVVLFNLYLGYRIHTLKLGLRKINWILLLFFVELLTGLAMNYLDFPFASQALHLVLASLLFGLQFYVLLEARTAERKGRQLPF